MPRPVLRTARIELRPMTAEHLPLHHRLDSDPEVMRHLTGHARTSAEIDEFWGPRCADTTSDALGLGWWVGFTDGEFLGWWDLAPGDPDPEVDHAVRDGSLDRTVTEAEIGWRLERRHWRQGYASEGAEALLRHAFDTLGLQRVWAEAMIANRASLGVMRKLGMHHLVTEGTAGHEPAAAAYQGDVVCEMTAQAWAERHRDDAR